MSDPLSARNHDRKTKESLDAIALRIWESQQRDRRRTAAVALRVTMLVVLPLAMFVAWLATTGYQRHVLQVRRGDTGFRIVSRRSPFEISIPSADFARMVPGGIFSHIEDHVSGESIQPRSYDWASYVKTEQEVQLQEGVKTLDFWVNDVNFQLANGELMCGERRWLLKSGSTITIDVDRIPPTTNTKPNVPNKPPGR